ncbi:venom protease isoform X2 [Folsomia candida]|uniref:venom protease isoform X2 n=1 Tax=Folsomia candida TaxID=158441 RepID=UPI001604B9DE|nr:venom protease isoform X2 [Folsomia candida]
MQGRLPVRGIMRMQHVRLDKAEITRVSANRSRNVQDHCPISMRGSESGSGSRTPLICCESDPRSRVSYQKCAEYSETTARNDKEAVNAAPTFLLPSNIPSSNIPKENEGWGSGSLETATVTPLAFVVGGEDARVGQFPYMAALGFGQNRSRISWLCGGTLVSDHHVLTAAHCLQEKRGRGKPTFVLIGDAHLKVDLNNRVKSRRVVPIDQITIHPNYNPSTKHNDIGLVKLRDKVVLSANVKPACLPQPVNRLEMGNNQSLLTAAGWGLTEFAGSPSETLQYVELRRQSSQRCVAAYSQESDGSSQEIIPSQFCAGAGEDDDIPKDTCDGDSGSGLTLKRVLDNINLSPRFVVGITSFGSKYCGLDKPGVYTNVQSFLDWLEDTIWPIDD